MHLSQHHLFKRIFFFFIEYFWLLCLILADHVHMGLFLDFVPLDYVSVFMSVHALLITIALQYSPKSGSVMPPALFFFMILLTLQHLLIFHINCMFTFSSSWKNCHTFFKSSFIDWFLICLPKKKTFPQSPPTFYQNLKCVVWTFIPLMRMNTVLRCTS